MRLGCGTSEREQTGMMPNAAASWSSCCFCKELAAQNPRICGCLDVCLAPPWQGFLAWWVLFLLSDHTVGFRTRIFFPARTVRKQVPALAVSSRVASGVAFGRRTLLMLVRETVQPCCLQNLA